VAGISGSNSANNIQPNDLTVLNDEVLFEGISASDELGLWVTNGTAGGTHEVTGISGAVGILGPSDLTFFRLNIVSNAKVLFSALDASFKLGLWVTDGTSGGRTS
jgi:hypothetical protein